MGLMMAAMFSATMSVLSAEFNVTVSVLTRDIYQRVFRPNATGKELLFMGRLLTLIVGAIVTVGALFVAGFGGAFEANKLLGGLFAVPMIIPVIFGILLRKPQPWGALATLIIGTSMGFLLNANKSISWEVATLTEMAVCIVIFIGSGLFPSKDEVYNEKVKAFFHKLTIPFIPDAETKENDKFMQAIKMMYGIAFGLTGLMFIIMGIPSIASISGKLAMSSGFLCLCVTAFLYFKKDKI